MLKNVNKTILFVVLMFVCLINVKADCSYQERKELLNLSKSVTVKFNVMQKEGTTIATNPNSGIAEEIKVKKEYLQMNISGIQKGYFIVIENDSTSEEVTIDYEVTKNGTYVIDIHNVDSIINYNFNYYSTNSNCFAQKITTKKVKKPKKNYISDFDICTHEEVAENKYCKKYISTEFTLSEGQIIDILNSIVNPEVLDNSNEKEKNFIDLLKEFWYIPLILIVLIIAIIIVIRIRKKRGEL